MPKQKPNKVESPESESTPEPTKSEMVRIYEVTASMIMHQFTPNQRGKVRGEKVASIEFEPPSTMTTEDLEKRYLETGGIVLLETISRDEWEKRQAK